MFLFKSRHCLCYRLRKNLPATRDHDQVKEALLSGGGDRHRMEGASIQKLKDKLDSGDILLGDEVNKWKRSCEGVPLPAVGAA